MTVEIAVANESTLWDRIQDAYEGMNAPEIGRILGKQKQSVYRWRDGETPGLETLVEIARSRNRSLHWLVTGDGPKTLPSEQPSSEKTTHSNTAFEKHFEETVAGLLQRFAESTGRTPEQVLADGERRLADFRRTGEVSRKLPEDTGSKQPHLQADRPDQEPQTESEKTNSLLLLVAGQNEKMLALLEQVLLGSKIN